MIRFFAPVLIACALSFPSLAPAQETDWSQANTLGLYNTPEEGRINDNIWEGYSLDKAVRTISLMPHTLRSPAYRMMAGKMLLSGAPPVADSAEAPTLLAARLQKLIDYGLFEEARTLYNETTQDIPADYNLALIGIELILLNGDLAPACLDIQASATLFRDIPAWRELATYCRIRFGNETAPARDIEFANYPSLDRFMRSPAIPPASLTSATETFIAFADDKITAPAYDSAARDMAQLTDLFVALAVRDEFRERETYSCYAIESALRGIRDVAFLADTYAKIAFNADDLAGKSGAVTIHPCAIPAFFYQRLQKENRPEAEIRQDINLLIETTSAISPYALAPMAELISAHYQTGAPDMNDWRAALAVAAAQHPIPESWAVYAAGETTLPAMAAPLVHMQKANQVSLEDHVAWVQSLTQIPAFATTPLDYGLPLYYLRSLTGEFNKLTDKQDSIDYEKLFSLTYSENYIHSSFGTLDAMSLALNGNDVPGLVTIALATAGTHKPGAVDPQLIAGILASFHELKLEKEKQILAFDALH